MLFAPLNVAAFLYLPKEIRGAAVGLLALLRNEGGSVGTSVGGIILDRREQFHTLRLNEQLQVFRPEVREFLNRGQQFFLQHTGDPVHSQQLAIRMLERTRGEQATALTYFDVFWACAAVSVLLLFLIPMLRRSVAEKGTHIGAD